MSDLLVRCTFASSTGVPADAVSTGFAVTGWDLGVDDLTDLTNATWQFLNGVPTGGLATMTELLSPVLDRTNFTSKIEVYNITGKGVGDMIGSPIKAVTHTLMAATGATTALPSEVAFVMTLEAEGRADAWVEAPDGPDAGTKVDRPMQRRTGRMYWGPLHSGCVAIVSGVARPSSMIRDTALLALEQLADDIDAIGVGPELGVWSRVDATVRRVTHVSVDNAFDTQRRRGEKGTIRTRVAV